MLRVWGIPELDSAARDVLGAELSSVHPYGTAATAGPDRYSPLRK